MHLSSNQIRTTALKACLGAGVARGVAEDIADCCVCLLQVGIDPIGELVDLLHEFDAEKQVTHWVVNGDQYEADAISVLIDGPSAVDIAQAGKTVVCSTSGMVLLFGLLIERSAVFEINFAIDGLQLNGISCKTLVRDIDRESVNKMHLSSVDGGESVRFDLGNQILPSRETWTGLCTLADAILVPADAASRADAGAGNTDND